jgi:hypothetical protein
MIRSRQDTKDRWFSAAGSKGIWALLFSLLLLVTACSGDSDDSASSDADSFEPSAPSDDSSDFEIEAGEEAFAESGDDAVADAVAGESDRAEAGSEDEDSAGAATPTGLTPADLGREIIFTAQIEVDVDDVTTAGEEAVVAIERIGGFVFGQESRGGSEPRSIFIFKVRPQDFAEALEVLGGIGDLRNQTVSADDVTERVVDLEGRIQVAELGVARLRTALEATVSLEDFAEVERLLINRETDLELMRGQLRTVRDQIDLATITLVLSQDRVQNNLELQVSVYEEHDGGLSCPGQADLSMDSGTDLTVCFELINTGDQTLSQLTLVDTGLGIDADAELLAVFGDLGEPLAPGQSLIVA